MDKNGIFRNITYSFIKNSFSNIPISISDITDLYVNESISYIT